MEPYFPQEQLIAQIQNFLSTRGFGMDIAWSYSERLVAEGLTCEGDLKFLTESDLVGKIGNCNHLYRITICVGMSLPEARKLFPFLMNTGTNVFEKYVYKFFSRYCTNDKCYVI
jgi:hypothetical protein